MPSSLDSPNTLCVELCKFMDDFEVWPRVLEVIQRLCCECETRIESCVVNA